MRKAFLVVALVGLLFLLLFSALFTWRPELIRVVAYQIPDAETYKVYPQTEVAAADTAFNFHRALTNRDDLDTLKVYDGQHRLVSLKAYLEEGRTKLFMVIRNDTVIYQHFRAGYTDTTLTTLFSVAKTMVSVALGKALEEGKIKSLDEPLLRYVPELKGNPAYNAITLKHLMTMKSGLEFADATTAGLVEAFLSDEALYYYTEDIKKLLLAEKLVNTPGTVWKYKGIDVFLLTWALENATGQKFANYFQDKIWKQIGAAYPASWGLDHQNGLANTASRFQSTAIDLAKIGRLYLNKGKYNGKQVIPLSWINNSLHLNGERPSTSKGWQKTTQHNLWWIPQQGEKGDFAAEGMRSQRLYMDTLTNTIIVHFADKGAGDYPYRKISRYLSGLTFAYPR